MIEDIAETCEVIGTFDPILLGGAEWITSSVRR